MAINQNISVNTDDIISPVSKKQQQQKESEREVFWKDNKNDQLDLTCYEVEILKWERKRKKEIEKS